MDNNDNQHPHHHPQQQQQLVDDDPDQQDFNYSDAEIRMDDDDDNVDDDDDDDSDVNDNDHNHPMRRNISNDRLRLRDDTTLMMNDGEYDDDSNETKVTKLIKYIHQCDWVSALRRIKSHPEECRVIDTMQCRTPLHIACDHDAPAVIIQTLCTTYPEATVKTGTSNMNPLHITCSSPNASAHIVRLLLEYGKTEQCSMRDVDGDTPLHTACRCGAPREVLEVLLRVYPDAIHTHDYEDLTPLSRLWVRYVVILGDDYMDHVHTISDIQGELFDAWTKTELLLRYAHYGPNHLQQPSSLSSAAAPLSKPLSFFNIAYPPLFPTSASASNGGGGSSSNSHNVLFQSQAQAKMGCNHRSHVLHAAAAVDCPRHVVQIATRIYHDELFHRDEHGRTPLMIACAAPVYPIHNLSDDGYTPSGVDTVIETIPTSTSTTDHDTSSNDETHSVSQLIFPQSSQPSVIEILLQASIMEQQTFTNVGGRLKDTVALPQSITSMNDDVTSSSSSTIISTEYGGADWIDPSGRLPLHIAIETGKGWYDGVQALVQIYPEAISIPDRSTKLYPYQLAAITMKGNNTIEDITTTYTLLRLNPSLLISACVYDANISSSRSNDSNDTNSKTMLTNNTTDDDHTNCKSESIQATSTTTVNDEQVMKHRLSQDDESDRNQRPNKISKI